MPPAPSQILLSLATQCCLRQEYDQARKLLDDVIEVDSSAQTRVAVDVLSAKILYVEDKWESSLAAANLILQQEPLNVEALTVRKKSWQALSYAAEDFADCRLINQLAPTVREHSDLIFEGNYLHGTTPEMQYQESRRWNDLYAAPLKGKILPHMNNPDPDRRLKIGYVSPDFRNHAIMKLLPCVLENGNNDRFELFAYFINVHSDSVTNYLRANMRNFVDLPSDTEQVVQRVRADGIDILVDLAGHTMPLEALLAFACKPAPVQVSWLGALATTGLDTMDYYLGDPNLPGHGTEHLFSEKVYRLSHAQHCYRPFGDPGIAASPFASNGHVTFGCFNNPRKITREMVQVWSVILHLHPTSKLLFKYPVLDRPMARQRLQNWFGEDGIPAERLLFEGNTDDLEHLASWNRVDIAFDPYPYNGCISTLDALWMGVPVVSRHGRLAVSCCGLSLLAPLGMPVAQSFEEYIGLASELVKTVTATPDIKQRVRQALRRSELMDEAGLIRALEAAYRNMWRAWCLSAR